MNSQKTLRLLRHILAGITFVCLCFVLLRPIGEPDFFWHLSTGRWIVEHLSLPTYDPFNYTTPGILSPRDYFILTSYWLSQILYYGIHYVSGWNGFIILRFIILGTIIYFINKRSGDSDRTIFFSVLAVALIVFVNIYPFERPQVFSFVFFAILLYLLEYLREACSEQRVADSEIQTTSYTLHPTRYTLFFAPYTLYAKRYAMLPLLMLLWANMHGGYIIGQVVILVYLISEGLKFLHPSLKPMERSSYKRFLITGTAGILSALINPNTYKTITVMLTTPKSFALYNAEYLGTIDFFKTYFNFSYSIPVYWLLLLIASAIMLYRIVRKRFDVLDIVMLAGLGYFSFTTIRYMAFFLIWAVPFISISLTSPTPSPIPDLTPWLRSAKLSRPQSGEDKGRGNDQKPFLRYVCFLLSIFIIAIFIKPIEFYNLNITNFKENRWVNDNYPDDAVNFIKKNNIKGNMFNYYDWGGYLIWRFYPEKKVFADGRDFYGFKYLGFIDIFSAAFKPEIGGVPYYKAILESYRVRYMVMPLYTQWGEIPPIVGEMIRGKEWVPVFFSDNSMVFVKDTPENYDLIRIYAIPKNVFVDKLFQMLDGMIREAPGDFSLYLAKGDLYRSQWRLKEARAEYEKVLEINPFNVTAKERLKLWKMKGY